MKQFLLDTNILVNIIRSNDFDSAFQLINPHDYPLYISIVSEGEIKSIAIRNKWGSKRQQRLNDLLDYINIIDITQLYVNSYSQIDTYSQKVNPDFTTYSFATPRNMGKNDLWIASTAALLDLTLITTDSDFDHLNNVFFEINKISAIDFIPFL